MDDSELRRIARQQEDRERERDRRDRERERRERSEYSMREEEHEAYAEEHQQDSADTEMVNEFMGIVENAKECYRSGEFFPALSFAFKGRKYFRNQLGNIVDSDRRMQLTTINDHLVELLDDILKRDNFEAIASQGAELAPQMVNLIDKLKPNDLQKMIENYSAELKTIESTSQLDTIPDKLDRLQNIESDLSGIEQNIENSQTDIEACQSCAIPLDLREDILGGKQKTAMDEIYQTIITKVGYSFEQPILQLDFLLVATVRTGLLKITIDRLRRNYEEIQERNKLQKANKRRLLFKLALIALAIIIFYSVISNIKEKNADKTSEYRDTYIQALNSKDEESAISILKEHTSDLSEVAVVAAAAHSMTRTAIAAINEHSNIDKSDGTGFSAIHYAVDHNDTKLMTSLLKNGVDVNKTVASSSADGGQTALIRAVKHGNDKIVKMLLSDTHIDINIRDLTGKSAEDYASEMNKKNILHLIKIQKKKS